MKVKAITTIMLTLFLASMLSMAFNVGPVKAETLTKTIKVETEGYISLTGALASTFASVDEIKFEAVITYTGTSVGGEAELTVEGEDSYGEDVKFEAKWDITTELTYPTHPTGGNVWLYYGGSKTDGVEFKVGDVETTYTVASGRFGSWEKSWDSNGPDKLNIVVDSPTVSELLRVTGSSITELEYILPLFLGWGSYTGSESGEVVVEIKESTFEVLVTVSANPSTNYQVHFGYLTPTDPALDHFGPLTPWAHWGPPYPLVSWVQLGDFTTDEDGDGNEDGDGKLSLELVIQSEQLFTGIFAINNFPWNTVLHTGAYPDTLGEIISLGIDTISFAVP